MLISRLTVCAWSLEVSLPGAVPLRFGTLLGFLTRKHSTRWRCRTHSSFNLNDESAGTILDWDNCIIIYGKAHSFPVLAGVFLVGLWLRRTNEPVMTTRRPDEIHVLVTCREHGIQSPVRWFNTVFDRDFYFCSTIFLCLLWVSMPNPRIHPRGTNKQITILRLGKAPSNVV